MNAYGTIDLKRLDDMGSEIRSKGEFPKHSSKHVLTHPRSAEILGLMSLYRMKL